MTYKPPRGRSPPQFESATEWRTTKDYPDNPFIPYLKGALEEGARTQNEPLGEIAGLSPRLLQVYRPLTIARFG
ncbi:hypothetical protein AZA_35381 [Nitrospirillum viridazoti Y2]|nr:hypothetical protein AZA_35381 [Nitrospirillum amazonense Y2]